MTVLPQYLLFLLAALFALPAQAQIWVTSTASSGTGTLRAAILGLNPSTSALQEIRFALPTTSGNPVAEIVLDAPLPVINGVNVLTVSYTHLTLPTILLV